MVNVDNNAEVAETVSRWRPWVDRVLHYVVLALFGVAFLAQLWAVPLALRWSQQPFLGALVEVTHIVNDINSQAPDQWSAFRQGVKVYDRLLAINGVALPPGPLDLSGYQVGEFVTLTVERASGEQATIPLILTDFKGWDFLTMFVIPFGIGLAYLAIGAWVFRQRSHEMAGRIFAAFCLMTSISAAGMFDFYTTHRLLWLWTVAMPGMGATLITLGLVFPQEFSFIQRRPHMRLLSFVPLFIVVSYTFFAYTSSDPRAYLTAWLWQDAYLGLGLLVFTGAMFYRRSSGSPAIRDQSSVILIGMAAAAGIIFFFILQLLFGRIIGYTPLPFNPAIAFPPAILFPLAVAWAILRYRLLDTDAMVARMLVYGILGAFTVIAYALLLFVLALIIGSAIQAYEPFAVGLLVFLLVAAFNPLRERLQHLVNIVFFRGTRQYTQQLEDFGRAVTRAVSIGEVRQALENQIEAALRPAHFHLFLKDPLNNDYAAYAENQPRPTTEIRFPAESALATLLADERSPLYLAPDVPLSINLRPDRARMLLLNSVIYAPLQGQTGLVGWLAIGPKLAGEAFSREDLRFIEALTDQSALAIERATMTTDMEKRVRELNVLSQMSQAVSFTVSFDDLLELIYAQTSKIVDTRNFYIILRDLRTSTFRYAFYVENDERDLKRENSLWGADRGLAGEIVRTGQPIRTDEYVIECRRRGVPPRNRDFKAWMGVPLNAGADAIGVMHVASLTANATFTDEQLKIFWAIGDQAASAIVKARLFQQTSQRARQLATLNEVGTSMASTLELDPLLRRITQSSMDLLACEAGSLFLIDEETGEYIFKVAVGPVGQNLVGMRIAPGKGFVGGAVESKQPLIVNDVQNDPRWFKGADQSSGFITQALMVVPLRRGDRSVGAIEVINKRDGTPFDEDDQNLLASFAGQAAVAIVNARLYDQTDKALEARVSELTVLQRIDRELNTTLDLKRVMQITLDWAMKNTGAMAGFIGTVQEKSLAIIATAGYGEATAALEDNGWPLNKGVPGRVVRTGEIGLARDVQLERDYQMILPATQSQLVIPIQGEKEVVGLINLESATPDAFTDDQVAFVSRLLDHASVAFTNSRLYAEVNAANSLKSDFISFVAHELKTPMTSIKGYADLMIGNAVGPINDMQRQFLSTIRNNVERMTTIVNDLNDQAKMEAGKMRLEPKEISFQDVIDDVVHTTQGLINAKKQRLTLEIEPALPHVWADRTRVTQVLINLMSNAYKYTPESGEIVLRVTREDNQWANGDPHASREVLRVSVKDNGIGISPEDQKKLFQKFFRAEDRMAREMAAGTGLGLNIVKQLIELQGGQIWFESEFRKGSTFHFTVPLEQVELPAAASPVA